MMPGVRSLRFIMEEQSDIRGQNISRGLKTLVRGLTQGDLTETYEGYKTLFRMGAAAIPQVRDAVFKSSWSQVTYPNEIRYVTGLVNLIHDIDESEAKKIVNQLKLNGCDPAVARILDSICKFTLTDYTQYRVRGVNIFEHRSLATKQNVKARLEQWLKNVPGEDLQEIERIYVLRREDLEGLGSYRPILCRIHLVWDNPSPKWSPMSLVNNFIIESTLYHEIGHHVHRHVFGQDPGQEREAEDYSDRIMAHSSHLLFRVGRLLSARSNKGMKRTRGQRTSHPQG